MLTPEQGLFERNCVLLGFKPEDYLAKFILNNDGFELVGLDLNKPKNNCVIRKLGTDTLYNTNDRTVKLALEKERANTSK